MSTSGDPDSIKEAAELIAKAQNPAYSRAHILSTISITACARSTPRARGILFRKNMFEYREALVMKIIEGWLPISTSNYHAHHEVEDKNYD